MHKLFLTLLFSFLSQNIFADSNPKCDYIPSALTEDVVRVQTGFDEGMVWNNTNKSLFKKIDEERTVKISASQCVHFSIIAEYTFVAQNNEDLLKEVLWFSKNLFTREITKDMYEYIFNTKSFKEKIIQFSGDTFYIYLPTKYYSSAKLLLEKKGQKYKLTISWYS